MHNLKADFAKDNKPRFSIDMTKGQPKSALAFDLDENKASTGTSTPPALLLPAAERR
jgi:hypothetical protein